MSSNTERYNIWEIIKDGMTLEGVLDLLKEDYKSPISYLVDHEISDFDKTFQNKWVDANGNNNIIISSFKDSDIYENDELNESQTESDTNNDGCIRYIHVKAIFEKGLGEDKAIVRGNVLPRESRVFNRSCDVCFVEIESKIYIILNANVTDEPRIRNVLLNVKDSTGKNRWGKIKYKNLMKYSLNSDFFYWLLYKKGSVKGINMIEGESIKVIDVSLVIQQDALESYTTHSIGVDILGSTSALSGFAENQIINKTGVVFVSDNVSLYTLIEDTGVFHVNKDETELNVRFSKENNFITTALYLYTYLIPSLIEALNTEKKNNNWGENLISEKRKEWAMNAILNLMLYNDIDTEEIDEAEKLREE